MRTRQLEPLENAPQTMAEPIAAFCGVGNPKSFFAHLRSEGHSVVLEKALPDHHPYTQRDIDLIARLATQAGAKSLITTAKDAVKLRTLKLPLPSYSLNVEISIDNETELESLILRSVGLRTS